MSEENKKVLLKRLKSLGWRTGMMCLAIIIDFTATNLNLFDLSPTIVTFIGLMLGEISKHLNRYKVAK